MSLAEKKDIEDSKSKGCIEIKNKLERASEQLKLLVLETESIINSQQVDKKKEVKDVD